MNARHHEPRLRWPRGNRSARDIASYCGPILLTCAGWGLGCQAAGPPATMPAEPEAKTGLRHPSETHFSELLQLTDGGENAEAYWAFGGDRLIFQAHAGEGCDQIYTMQANVELPTPQLVSTGKGATTCAYYLPGDEEIVYSSTHLGGDACPPKPDHSKGYVWALYPSYDIFRAGADGSNLRPLTTNPGYDAEATICPKDGSILFTSMRDGDLELYRMDADGSHVQRLTHTPGYDGGAFFSQDCDKIVWRASRPQGGALEEYRSLLAENPPLVRPSKLEIFVANADGSDARQITYLNAAAFAPYFTPDAERVLFSTNAGDPRGREFDIWAVNVDGSALEQITHSPGFDGFPMFSPDGKKLAFSSNRASRPGTYDTNVFVTDWVEHPPVVASESSADRVMRDIQWLADPAREGRGVGTEGLVQSGAYVEAEFQRLGLEPAGVGGFRQPLEVVTHVKSAEATQLELGGQSLAAADFQPLGFSASGAIDADLVLVGYGIQNEEVGRTDYAGHDVRNRIAVVRRFVPTGKAFKDTKAQRRHGDLRKKAWQAREKGARGLIVVDQPERPADAGADWTPPPEASFPSLNRSSYGDAGIPVVIVKRERMAASLERLERGRPVKARLEVALELERKPVFNVLGRLRSKALGASTRGAFVVGAHYDHLGYGGPNSLAPDSQAAHVGADDNASGVALVLEVARRLSQRQDLPRDIVFAAFTAEEMGILGSSHLVKNPPPGLGMDRVYAMLNFDMVGRLQSNQLSILGAESAAEWNDLVPGACQKARVDCHLSGSGYGPSDHSAFYGSGVPVLHFFTGAHSDYHKPSDQPELINGAGVAQISELVSLLLADANGPQKLTYRQLPPAEPRGDMRSFNASLGTIPDYSGPPGGKGVLLSGVRPGSGAALGGMRRGDVLVQLGKRKIDGVHDLMYALNSAKPNQTVSATVLRNGESVRLQVTYQERSGRGRSPHGKKAKGAHPHGKSQRGHQADHQH